MPQMCRGSSRACCKPSENRTQLNPRHARALRPPARPTTLRSARRQPRRAAARAARALRAARRRRGEPALPRLSRPLVRAWRPRVAAQVRSEWEGKELRGGRRTMGDPPGAYACICAVWSKGGGRRAQAAADAGPEGAGAVQVTTAREHVPKTKQSLDGTMNECFSPLSVLPLCCLWGNG